MIAADHDDVIERAATTEPRCPQTIYFVEKAKSTRSTELRFESRCIEHYTHLLLANQRVGETDFEAHRKTVIGQQRGRCTVLGDGYRFEHLYRAPRCLLFDEPGAFDQKEQGGGATVHDGHFWAVQLDDRVVDL